MDNRVIQFIGDLSIEDAMVLEQQSFMNSVLEFGVGGSTQIFAQNAERVLSIDTDAGWIERTKKNITLLDKTRCNVEFRFYDEFDFSGLFDVVFVDGAPEKRLEFAERAWKCLTPGGTMIFHDTRRFEYFKEAAWIMQLFFTEIKNVRVNYKDSNLTVIHKRMEPLAYVNWNETEGKPAWAYGAAERPDGEGLWIGN